MANYDLPGKTILMHNRCGMRIELNFDREGLLVLWISPKAGRSISYIDRNFSNRDDHTSVFDRISLKGLSAESFVRCEYDPFYSRIVFKDSTLHILNLFDKPLVLLWSDSPVTIALKSDKQDAIATRDAHRFIVGHPDRGTNFTFAAVADAGGAEFVHQLQLDDGRSTYASITLQAGQRLAVAGELSEFPVRKICDTALRQSTRALTIRNEKLISHALAPGSFELNGRRNLQRLLDKNRRVLLSMQDLSGAIRAAINRIYYLIWVRDGAIIQALSGYSGSSKPLADWTKFLLANPLDIKGESPEGTTFGMLVNKISKWEEDGIFFAIWSAFAAWTQTGDRKFIMGKNLDVLESAMEWLERYCYVKKQGLFGRFFACESPFPGSRDDGFDNAVGYATGKSQRKFDGKPVRQAFDVYINLLCYASYVMLSGMHSGAAAEAYLRKAKSLAANMEKWFAGNDMPPYGLVRTADNKMNLAGPYGLDICDYVWAFTVPPFFPAPAALRRIRSQLHDVAVTKPRGYFLSSYFTMLASLDIDSFSEKKILKAVDYAARQCYRPGNFLPMPDTIIEMLDMEDGHRSHDVRPQAFSISPWLATITGLGLRRLPYGLAVRATKTLKCIRSYEYKKSRLTFLFKGTGNKCILGVNGRPVPGSLQIPEDMLKPGDNMIQVKRTRSASVSPLLISSTIALNSVRQIESGYRYCGIARGKNVLEFRNVSAHDTMQVKVAGRPAKVAKTFADGITFFEFDGRGDVEIEIKRT